MSPEGRRSLLCLWCKLSLDWKVRQKDKYIESNFFLSDLSGEGIFKNRTKFAIPSSILADPVTVVTVEALEPVEAVWDKRVSKNRGANWDNGDCVDSRNNWNTRDSRVTTLTEDRTTCNTTVLLISLLYVQRSRKDEFIKGERREEKKATHVKI